MKKIMKMFAISMMVAIMSVVAVNAQSKGDMAVGGNLAIGMGDDITNFGIGGKFQYNVIDPLRLEGSLTFFLPKSYGYGDNYKLSMWNFDMNAHYLFPVANQVTIYPLGGLGVQGWKSKIKGNGSHSDTDLVINFGGGVDIKLTNQLVLNGELKYRVGSDFDRFIISAGIAYKF